MAKLDFTKEARRRKRKLTVADEDEALANDSAARWLDQADGKRRAESDQSFDAVMRRCRAYKGPAPF